MTTNTQDQPQPEEYWEVDVGVPLSHTAAVEYLEGLIDELEPIGSGTGFGYRDAQFFTTNGEFAQGLAATIQNVFDRLGAEEAYVDLYPAQNA